MEKGDKYNLIWTLMCFGFIAILIIIFKNANTLWLLLLWLMGWKSNETDKQR